MLDYENASAAADIRFERIGDVLTIKLPKEGFARGMGNLFRSWQFWLYAALMFLILNLSEVARLLTGEPPSADRWPQQFSLMFLPIVGVMCGHALTSHQVSTTIRLYRRELVLSSQGLFSSTRETGYERREITDVRVGWINLSLALDRRSWFGACHNVNVFLGRTREERERVAQAIRAWLDATPPDARG